MGVKFLGTEIEKFEQLIKEEEKVVITVSCYKEEPLYTHNSDVDGGGTTVEMEQVLTAQWGQQILSTKDIFQFDGDAAKVYAVDLNKKLEMVN